MNKILLLPAALLLLISCKNTPNPKENANAPTAPPAKGSFAYDLDFLKKHTETLLLLSPDVEGAQIAVAPGYQGRVMTSTAAGGGGNSYGWLNYSLISGEKGYQPHINAWGGEDRFWIAPEGGQFSVFFQKGAAFDFDHWQTPGLIDTARFELVDEDKSHVVFNKKASLENYSGTRFDLDITRKVSVLGKNDVIKFLNVSDLSGLKYVGFETTNTLINVGADWKKDRGTLGIWILGMFTPSDKTTVVTPFSKARSSKLLLTDDYFGKVPAERLAVADSTVFFRGDGKLRSKIGIAPASAKPVAGSFDAEKGILTIVQFDLDPAGDYLKSTWKRHAEPYKGDAFNSYNDGPVADGAQLGPFYELESTSPAPALKSGEKLVHRHRTFHFEGGRDALDRLAKAVLGVGLSQIETALK